MSDTQIVPETRVLAIASHVVHGYVGNTMAAFVMQALGCEVCAINTVNYSNHTAYKHVRGTKTPADEIATLFTGLEESELASFDVLLSGYIPSAAAISAVGTIGHTLKTRAQSAPGSFFWVLDPVLGDNGKLYVPPDEVPVYQSLLEQASLILPNQFEAEVLSGVKIDSMAALAGAVRSLHQTYGIPHIVVTSLRLSPETQAPLPPSTPSDTLTVIGSTATSGKKPRLWRIDIPALPYFFSGTGDMFAALMVARLREQVAMTPGLGQREDWVSEDSVAPADLPLARAAEKVLASMQAVLADTAAHVRAIEAAGKLKVGEEVGAEEREKIAHLRLMKASEVRVVRNQEALRNPPDVERIRAREVVIEEL